MARGSGSRRLPAAQRALTWAVHQAAQRAGAVHVVHAWPRPRHLTLGPPAFPNQARDEAEALLLAAVTSLPDRRGVRISTQAVAGKPIDALTRAAIGADVLVLGRDGGHPGSVYDQCVRSLSCDVILSGYPTPGANVVRRDTELCAASSAGLR